MPAIADLLDQAQIQRLARITTEVPTTPMYDRDCTCDQKDRNDGLEHVGGLMIHKACGLPRPRVAVLRGATTTKPKKERTVIDLNEMSPAQLGMALTASMQAEIAEALPEACSKAERKRAKAEAKAKEVAAAERRTLLDMGTLPGFTLKTVEVPDLEVSSIASLNEMPAKAFRSPYNRLRSRHNEPLLPTTDEPATPACTWRDVIADHQRFALMAKQETHVALLTEPAGKPKKAKKAKAPKVEAPAQIAAPVDTSEKTKRKALMALGYTKAEAKQILATV